MSQKTLLENLLGLVPAQRRQEIRTRIEREMARHAAGDDLRALRFLEDLDALARMRGPDFMYARGIAGSLRVNEEIFELAYAVQREMS